MMSSSTHLKHLVFGGVLLASLSLTGQSVSAQMDEQRSTESCTPGGYMMVMGGIEDPSTVPDMTQARKYGPAVWDLVESYDAFYVVRKTPDVVYEGNWPDWKAGVISKWPCQETGVQFWNSNAYQNEVKPLRKAAGVYEVGMFEAARAFPQAKIQDLVPANCRNPFLVVIMSKVTDPEAYGQYGKAIMETGLARRAGIRMLFSGQPQEVLEGDWPADYNTMVSVYPCREAWEAFYAGEPYTSEIRPLRANAGDFIIMGFEPERVE
ncbi:MAG: DUF1330 domain-containing protein [Rhodospirillaceae bacterium]|jgi:uncharacterized protein (DUF1330 family)